MGTLYKKLLIVLFSVTLFYGVNLQAQTCVATSIDFTVFNGNCSGSPGGWTVNIPPSACIHATTFPWTISWFVPPGCPTPTLNSVAGPTTLATFITGTCGSSYLALLNSGSINIGIGSPASNPIIPPGSIFFLTGNNPPSCNGGCNGSAQVQVTTANPPFSYTFTPSATGSSATASGLSNGVLTFTGLCSGLQTLLVQNASGCINTFTFNVNQPSVIAANTATSSPSCFGGNNGTFSISPSGGTPNYTVAFSNGQTLPVTSGGTVAANTLTNGVYTATITDVNSCTFATGATITQPSSIIIVPTQTNVNCFGANNGSGSVSVSGGGGIYTYSWSPITGSAAVNNSLTGGSTVNHTVLVTDNNNCTRQQTFSITQPSSIILISNTIAVSCFSLCTGAATISASGPTSAVSYTWTWMSGTVQLSTTTATNAANISTLNGLCAGNYSIIARDLSTPNTCLTTSILTISQPTPFVVSINAQSITCINNPCTGSATINLSGGNGPPYTYSLNSVLSGSVINSLCASAIPYTVSVSDASTCPGSNTFVISQPSLIAANITSINPACSGTSNGTINASPSGGTAPYTFSLVSSGSTVTTNPPYTNLGTGTYVLFINDASAATCPQSYTVVLTSPNVLSSAITSVNIACFGVPSGSLFSNPTGGAGPIYTHTWTITNGTVVNTVNTASVGGLGPSTYTYTLKDLNNCTFTASGTFTSPNAISVNVPTTNVTCSGATNGVLTASVSGGTPGYTFSWTPSGPGSTSNPYSGLGTGTFALIVRDANNCPSSVITSTVGSPPPVSISSSIITAPSCAGFSNGSATITGSGGTPTYTYNFTTPAPVFSPVTTNTTGICSTFTAGAYLVTVTDLNSCLTTSAINIPATTLLSAAITGNQKSCSGCTGAGTVTASNGTPGYSYSWTNSLSVVVATAAVASALCPGDYTVTVTDSKLCAAQANINIAQTIITATASTGPLACSTSTNGTAVVSPAGGTLPYTFTWTPSGQNTQTATSLSGNIVYNVLIKESGPNACTSSTTLMLTPPASITVNGTTISPSCSSSTNGAINTTSAGGTGALSYIWSGPSGSGQTTPSLTGVGAGTFVLNVSDANFCTAPTLTFILTPPSSIAATFNTTAPTACTLSNGSVCAVPSGGSGAGYTFNWAPPVSGTNNCIANVPAGVYNVTVTDGAGCFSNFSTSLGNLTGPVITSTTTAALCFSQTSGSASITATGSGPFTYTWSSGVAGNTPVATALAGGTTYIVTIRDNNGCITNTTIAVGQTASLTINSTTTNPRCASGASNGSITISPTGGTPAYTYSWTGAGTATSQNVTGLGSGTFGLIVTDANLCTYPFTFTLNAPPAISITASSTKTIVCLNSTGSISASASGGVGSLSYTWAPLPPFSGSITTSVFNLGPGVYSVNAVDANGCSASVPATWTLNATTLATTQNSLNATCSNSANGAATINVTGGTPTYTFSWSNNTTTTNTQGGLSGGNYTASVIDADGCISNQTFTISPPANFSVSLTASNPKCNGTLTGSITTVLSGGTGTINYVWTSPAIGQNPTNLGANVYNLLATDANGCQTSGVATLIDPPLMLANLNSTPPSCNAVCNGSAFVAPINAVGTLSITWSSGGPNSPTTTGLCGNIPYTVTVTDANGCFDSQPFTLTAPTAITINTLIVPPTCGSSNGSVTIVPSGGVPAYSYTWSPNVSSTVSAGGLSAQVYTVTIKDNANCTNTFGIPVGNSNGPVATINSTNNLCFGQTMGAASVGSITGGTPPYSTIWFSPGPSQTVNAISSLSTIAGGYSVQLTDALGCITFTGTYISESPSITVNPTIKLPTCNGICDGSITISTSGGVGPYTLSWSPVVSSSSVLTNLCALDYTLLITHNNGSCSATNIIPIAPQINLTFTKTVVPNTCFGSCNGVANVSVVPTLGIPSPFAFSWSNGQTSPGPLSTSINNLCNNVYVVTATGANGCFNRDTVTITSPPAIVIGTSSLEPNCGVCNGSVNIIPSGGAGAPYTYAWPSGASGSSLTNLCAGIYVVNISDAAACTQSQIISLSNSSGITSYTFNSQNIPCGGNCNGSATIAASSTNQPITYNWINPAISNSVISNLCQGAYYVQMIDGLGCVKIDSTVIQAATNITISSFVSPPTCGVLTNGTVNLVVSGGSPTYSFSWSPASLNSGTLTNVGPGSYTVTVTDTSPGGCPTTSLVDVSSFNAPSVNVNTLGINCNGFCTGAATAIVTGTAPPFSYNWSIGGNISNVSNLCKGVITLTVTDSNTCIAIRSATIDDNPAIQINPPNINQPSCNQCNGNATISAFGGVAPYTYSWSNGSTGTVVSNLCAALLQVTVKDSKNCSQIQNVLVNNSSGITSVSFTTQHIPCGANCNGALTVTATGTNTPLTYNWINPAASGTVINNLCPGNYFVQIQDATGCLLTRSANISAASNITLTPLILPPACGTTNGQIVLGATGGVPAYSYNWTPSAPNSATLNGVGPGSYSVTVTDSAPGGCSTTTAITISNLNAPGINFNTIDVNCFGQCTGATTANVTGTTSPFTYNWSSGGNASTASNLCKGVITLTVTDTKTCVAVKSLTINENPLIQLSSPNVSQPNCNQCNGAVVVSAIGGVLPYTYTWTNGSVGASLNGLCAGLYQVAVVDQKNCQQTQNVIINNSNGITGANFTVQNMACASTCNGAATITPVGGTNPIAFSWINPNLNNTTNVANNLCVGNYFVQMSDAFGCLRTASTSIVAASNMTLTASSLPPDCNASNGFVSVTVTGGTLPYTYSWSPGGASSSSLSGQSAGTYTVLVKDNNGNGCQVTQSFNLSNLNGPSFTSNQSNVNCFGLCTGSINLTNSGTVATTYNWSNGSSGQTISNLCKGLITLTATANGCKTMQSFTIQENPKLQLTTNLIKLTCANKCDAQIALLPIGGLLSYSFNSGTTLNGNIANNLCANKYTFSITDQAGCLLIDSVRIINPIAISSIINYTNSSCASVRDASANVVVSGGTPTYKYNWSGPTGFISTQAIIKNILSGTYTLSVTDTLGCKKDSIVTLKSNIEVDANAGLDSTICPQLPLVLDGSKSTNTIKYNWYQLPNSNLSISSNVKFTIPKATITSTYMLVATSSVVTCSDTDLVVFQVFVEPFIDAGPSYTIPVFSSVTIGGGPTTLGAETVNWIPAFSLDNPIASNPIASNTVNTSYTVSVAYGKGCIAFDTVRVDVYPEIKISGGFSPNNDGKNDVFIIDYLEQFPDHEVEIFNRWGDRLYYAKNYNQTPWDGTFKGRNLPVGTYYYVVRLNHPGYPKPYTGPVTVFR